MQNDSYVWLVNKSKTAALSAKIPNQGLKTLKPGAYFKILKSNLYLYKGFTIHKENVLVFDDENNFNMFKNGPVKAPVVKEEPVVTPTVELNETTPPVEAANEPSTEAVTKPVEEEEVTEEVTETESNPTENYSKKTYKTKKVRK